MSTAMRFTLSVILALASAAVYSAEPPASGAGEPGTLSEEATAAGPAVDTSATAIDTNATAVDASATAVDTNATTAANAEQPAAKPTTSSQRASGPRAVVRNDRLDLDTTVVTGNRELPKVLYIVPWKKSDLGELPAQPFNTLLDEALTPIDRDVFRREVTYYGAIASDGGGGPDAAPSPPERTEK